MDRAHPGYRDELLQIFGEPYPSPKEISDWKDRWVDSCRPVRIKLTKRAISPTSTLKEDIEGTAARVGIVPLYFDIHVLAMTRRPIFAGRTEHIEQCAVKFYNEEYLAMFNLAWNPS